MKIPPRNVGKCGQLNFFPHSSQDSVIHSSELVFINLKEFSRIDSVGKVRGVKFQLGDETRIVDEKAFAEAITWEPGIRNLPDQRSL